MTADVFIHRGHGRPGVWKTGHRQVAFVLLIFVFFNLPAFVCKQKYDLLAVFRLLDFFSNLADI